MLKFLLQHSDIKIDRKQRRFFAVLIWIILYTILFIPWLGYNYRLILIIPALEIISMLFAFVLNEKVLTFLLVRKRIVLYAFLILVLICTVSYVIGSLQHIIVSKFEVDNLLKPHQMMLKTGVLMLYSVFVSTIITFALQNYDDREIRNNLVMEKREMEMKFLKMQINPHFLFNSLNNIYSMAVTEDRNTPESIMRLSNMLRYVLDNTSGFVGIDREIAHLQDFIEFNRLCSETEREILFATDIRDKEIQIPAMLLQPLLENCFKHGDPNSYLKITLRTDDGIVTFCTENRIRGEQIEDSTGIGLQNVRKRAELYYPNRYTLETNQEYGIFTMCLSLNTNAEDHV